MEKLFEKFIKNNSNKTQKLEKENIISKIWNEILGYQPKNEDNFILNGGTSFKAIKFLDAVEEESFYELGEKFIDILLNKTYGDLVFYIQNFQQRREGLNLKRCLDENIKYEHNKKISFDFNDYQGFISKNCKTATFEKDDKTLKIDENLKLKIDILWKFDTKKCIDATVLLMTGDENDRVFIGSHSCLFASINANSGKSIWEFYAKDRIESSACLSQCKEYVVFGNLN